MNKVGKVDATLHVVAVISNPARFKQRVQLFKDFQTRMRQTPGVRLTTVECAYGDHAFQVTHADNPLDVQVRTLDELWIKENLINIGISRLPADWQYVAWIDGDVQFNNVDWVQETLHQLQTHHIVQLFQNTVDMGPNGEVLQVHQGFAYQYIKRAPKYWETPWTENWTGVPNASSKAALTSEYYGGIGQTQLQGAYWHSGYAWAANREAINAMGGLLDWAIIGAGDHHMAMAWIGDARMSVPAAVPPAYLQAVLSYQARCERDIKRDIGYVSGTLLHHWHGQKKNRKYLERWDILTKNKFDPNVDIHKDWQGLYQLNPDKIQLRDDLRLYFRQRNEDSIDLE